MVAIPKVELLQMHFQFPFLNLLSVFITAVICLCLNLVDVLSEGTKNPKSK